MAKQQHQTSMHALNVVPVYRTAQKMPLRIRPVSLCVPDAFFLDLDSYTAQATNDPRLISLDKARNERQ